MPKVTTMELAAKLDVVADNLDRLVNAMTAQAITAQPEAAAPEAPKEEQTTIKADAAYVDLMSAKAQAHADTKAEPVVLYGRRNKGGETKIAYALQTRFDTQVSKQASCLGAIKLFIPAS